MSSREDAGLRQELEKLLNYYSVENESNTPDSILASYILACLTAFAEASNARERWYGWQHEPGQDPKRIRLPEEGPIVTVETTKVQENGGLTALCAHHWGSPAYLVVYRGRSCFSLPYDIVGFRMRCTSCDATREVYTEGSLPPDAVIEEVPSQPVSTQSVLHPPPVTVRFSGETPWDAVVNHSSLDIEEEDSFLTFCAARGLSRESTLAELEAAFQDWDRER